MADRIAEGRIPVDEALLIANQIAEAIETAHEAIPPPRPVRILDIPGHCLALPCSINQGDFRNGQRRSRLLSVLERFFVGFSSVLAVSRCFCAAGYVSAAHWLISS